MECGRMYFILVNVIILHPITAGWFVINQVSPNYQLIGFTFVRTAWELEQICRADFPFFKKLFEMDESTYSIGIGFSSIPLIVRQIVRTVHPFHGIWRCDVTLLFSCYLCAVLRMWPFTNQLTNRPTVLVYDVYMLIP